MAFYSSYLLSRKLAVKRPLSAANRKEQTLQIHQLPTMTKTKFFFIAFLSLAISNTTFGQKLKFESFTAEQMKFKKDILTFLEAKLKDQNNKSFSDLQSSKFIAVQPMGTVYDSSYEGPHAESKNVDTSTLRKDSVYFVSFATDPKSQQAVVYNDGQTLIYNCIVKVTVYAFGNLMSFKVTRLETYIRHKSKWLMVSGSGTEYKPTWQPTPVE